MTERYDIDEKKMKEGLGELMKYRVNQVLEYAGPFTLTMAAESYFSTLRMVEGLGLRIDYLEYEKKIKEFEAEVNQTNKLEKISKQ